VKCFRTQGIFLSADMPFSNINSICQRGMPKDVILRDIKHRIGTIQAEDSCLRVTSRKPHCDIGWSTPKIYDALAVKRGKLLRKESDEFRI
jgi:hypothetical protein